MKPPLTVLLGEKPVLQFSAQALLTTSLDLADATGSNVLVVHCSPALFGNGSQNVVEYCAPAGSEAY
jgi:hypothetical protein